MKVIFGSCENMEEIKDESVDLIVTSPPYYNAPFDYPGLFENYGTYLSFMTRVLKEMHRVLKRGRIACIVIDDIIVDGVKYPIVSDLWMNTRSIINSSLELHDQADLKWIYRDRIVWRKPEGYIRTSRRSGVVVQHPYPMYYYPDNIQESILIWQKGKHNHKAVSKDLKNLSGIDLERFQSEKWYLNVWDITNVLPIPGRLEEDIAAFPPEIPFRLITLFSHKNEVVLDPFCGSGTTLAVARDLDRQGIGYDVDKNLRTIIREKVGGNVVFTERADSLEMREKKRFDVAEDF